MPFGQIPSLLAEQPISVLDRQYEEIAEFLHGYSGIHVNLEELSVSHQLVDWLKEAMKGISVYPCSDDYERILSVSQHREPDRRGSPRSEDQ